MRGEIWTCDSCGRDTRFQDRLCQRCRLPEEVLEEIDREETGNEEGGEPEWEEEESGSDRSRDPYWEGEATTLRSSQQYHGPEVPDDV